MFQGLDCSPIKAVRELGSQCREIVWSIYSGGVRALQGFSPSMRGPGRTHIWCLRVVTLLVSHPTLTHFIHKIDFD